MNWIDILLVLFLIGSSAVCSVSDLKRNIVPNKVVILTVSVAFLLQVVNALAYGTNGYSFWCLNTVIASLIAVLLYIAGFWAAGDVKLFFALLLCFPVSFAQENLSDSILIYIFIFSPAFLYLMIDTIVRLCKHEERFTYSHRISWDFVIDFLLISIELTALQEVAYLILPDFCAENMLLLSAFILIAAFVYKQKNWVRKIPFIVCHIIILIVCMFITRWTFGNLEWRVYLLIAAVFLLQRNAESYNYKRIPTASVRKGMILSSRTVFSFAKSRVKGLPCDMSEGMKARLTEEEVSAIHRWEESVYGSHEVIIVRKLPFALFISIGFLLMFCVKVVLVFQ